MVRINKDRILDRRSPPALNKDQIAFVAKIRICDTRKFGVLFQKSSGKNCGSRMPFKNEATATLLTTIHRENKWTKV